MSTYDIHSQASNFLGFVKTGVDPRTGQFTLAMTLPLPPANHLAGPSLAPTLVFSPLGSMNNRGFGLGWSFNLSELNLNPDAPTLRLCSGEQFAVDWDNSDFAVGGKLQLLDYKLRAMQVTRVSDESFRVDHKSGSSEILTRQANDHYLLSELRSCEGRRVFVDWLAFGDRQYIVESIRDESKSLMNVVSRDGEVQFISHPQSEHARTTMRLLLSNDQLSEVYLPGIDQPFSFEYLRHTVSADAQFVFPIKVSGPLGARDTVHWHTDEAGHQMPAGAPFRYLPRVATWTHSATGSVELTRTYQWIGDHNFLGFGSDQAFDWQQGRDNLYQVERDYQYELIEQQQDGDGQLLATLSRTWNRFHLLTLESSRTADCEMRVETTYGIDPELTWERQPPWCQLPHKTLTTYIDHSSSNARRSEQVEYRYDEYGNVLHTRYASGVQEACEYYPAAGTEGCPADALGMVRYLKGKTVSPAPVTAAGADTAPIIAIGYTYQALESLLEDGLSHAVVNSEKAFDVSSNRLLETTRQLYVTTRDAHYGRIAASINTLEGLDTRTVYRYEMSDTELVTHVTVQGHENDALSRSTSSSAQSLLSGLTTEERNEAGVRTAYEHDALGRVRRKTVAQGSTFEAVSTADYHLGDALALDHRPPGITHPVMLEQTDVTGQRKRSWLDGAGRPLCVELEDIDHAPGVFRIVSRTEYDALGRAVLQAAHDWVPGNLAPLTSSVSTRYDHWGHASEVQTADGLVAHTRRDPVALRTEHWQQAADKRGPRVVTLSNVAQSPIEQQLYDEDDRLIRTHLQLRDGLDRVVEERLRIEAQADIVTRSKLDAYSRLIERQLPDGTIINWTYALHSDAHHPETVTVTPAMEATA